MKKGLSAFQLKMVAVGFMTLDHIAAYLFELEFVGRHSAQLRTLGRIAAPIFLFVLAQSIKHTSSKKRLFARLYVANILLVALNTLLCATLDDFRGGIYVGNIFPTLCYTVLYAELIDQVMEGYQKRNGRKIALCCILFGFTLLLEPLRQSVLGMSHSPAWPYVPQKLVLTLLPSPLAVEYSALFIAMGLCWYYAKCTRDNCLVLVLFSLLSWLGNNQQWSIPYMLDFFEWRQYYMILGVPFLFAYNEQRGKPAKKFFYIYYLLHIYVMVFLQNLFFK